LTNRNLASGGQLAGGGDGLEGVVAQTALVGVLPAWVCRSAVWLAQVDEVAVVDQDLDSAAFMVEVGRITGRQLPHIGAEIEVFHAVRALVVQIVLLHGEGSHGSQFGSDQLQVKWCQSMLRDQLVDLNELRVSCRR